MKRLRLAEFKLAGASCGESIISAIPKCNLSLVVHSDWPAARESIVVGWLPRDTRRPLAGAIDRKPLIVLGAIVSRSAPVASEPTGRPSFVHSFIH